MTETWRAVPGYEGLYEVSDLGRVRSLDRADSAGRPLRGRDLARGGGSSGYLQSQLWRDGRRRAVQVHRLVLLAFVGPPSEGMEACHNDGNPANNALANLRWDTRAANERDKLLHGTHNNASKTHCKRGHEYTSENTARRNGSRFCRACQRDQNRTRRQNLDKEMVA